MNLLQQIEENRRAQNKKLLLETLNGSPAVTIEQVIEQLSDDQDMRNAFMALTIGEIQGLVSTAEGSTPNGSASSRAAAKQEQAAIDAAAEVAEEEVEEAEVEEDEVEDEDEVEAAPESRKKSAKKKPGKKTDKKSSAPKKKAPKKVNSSKKGSSKKKSKGINLRTPEGREEYDQQVVGALVDFGEPALAADIREKVGGTPAQLRASLNRLIELGQAGYEGATRSTRYFLNA